MDVTLVTTSFNDTVHGTFNGKFTGCKINLQKSENATKFRRTHLMTDLGEITCEKCKARIAKEMIKADQKEMKVLLKEEKLRAKRGIEDEGIVPLGNTTAKITGGNRRNDDRRDRRDYGGGTEYKGSSTGSSNNYGGGTEYTGSSNNYGGGTEYTGSSNNYGGGTEYTGSSNNYGGGTEYKGSSYNDNAPAERPRPAAQEREDKPMDEFSAFLAAQPKPRNPQPQAQQAPQNEPAAPAASPAGSDDYLAQFAIPKPDAPAPQQAAVPEDDFLAQFAIPAPAPAQPEPAVQQPQAQQPAPAMNTGDDIMNMFSIGAKPTTELDIFNNAPAPQNAYGSGSDAIDTAADALTPAGAPSDAQPGNSGNSEWDRLANQLFGFGGQEAPQAVPAQPAQPAAPAPLGMDDLSFPAPGQTAAPIQPAAAPVLDDISAPILDDISAPGEIVIPEAVSDDLNSGLSDEDFMEDDVDDSELLDTDDDTAVIEDIVSAAVPRQG